MKKRIIRVFPTKTNATPTDELVRIRETPSFFDEADEVHVSVTFTWDIPIAEWLAKQWEPVATVKIGGPAYNEPGGDFIPGMYMRHGYVITSRGCPNRCWVCAVPKREGGMHLHVAAGIFHITNIGTQKWRGRENLLVMINRHEPVRRTRLCIIRFLRFFPRSAAATEAR